MKEKKEIEVIARGVFVKDGKLLLCHSKGADNTYLPGGHVEWGESAAVALCREIEEELGCRAVAGRFLGVSENSFFRKGERYCEINLVFEMNVKGLRSNRNPEACEDYIEFYWIPMKRLKASRMEPAALRKVLPLWLKKKYSVQRWITNMV